MSDIRQSVQDYVLATQALLKQGNLSDEELQSVDEMLQRVLAMLKENGRTEAD